jgi:hypothetical protein
LVTDALQHARPACAQLDDPGRCRLTLEHPDQDTVWVSVADSSRRRVLHQEPTGDAKSGCGLAVVNALAGPLAGVADTHR